MNLINDTRADTEFTYYTIIPEDYLINGAKWSILSATDAAPEGRHFPVIIDSGFTTNPLPPSLVTLYYAAFAQPPQPLEIDGQLMFAAPCDTAEEVLPTFGVQIGWQVFDMSRETRLVARLNATEAGSGVLFCALGVQPGIEEAGALGDTFLSGVVAVFDFGGTEMRFATRGVGEGVGEGGAGEDGGVTLDGEGGRHEL